MADRTYTCLVISDFNSENFVGYLREDASRPKVEVQSAPFGQVVQTLLDPGLANGARKSDVLIVWTQAHGVCPSFGRLLEEQPVPLEAILDEVDAFAQALLKAAERAACVLVPSWVLPGSQRGFHLRDLKAKEGAADTLMRMQLRLAERVAQSSSIHLLNTSRWIEAAGKRAVNPKLWYMAKVPFSNDVWREAVRDIKAALAGIFGQAKKLIIVDLDDTLWGGVVGEIGWQNLTLGGHDPAGEAFVDFQQALQSLSRKGILLGIVSKNEEAVSLEAIAQHPEMVLRNDAFAGWRINWQDKARNVADLATELNLGLQSIVFIDDHPAERSRVRETLPEVLVPDWPDDPMLYKQALMNLGCFQTPAVSTEDRERTQLYVTERKRSNLREQVGSVDEWLKTLGITVTFEPLNAANLPRAAQLLNKTNQMNLSTRRLSEPELMAWVQAAQRKLWTIRVDDKFGSAGLTGLLSLENDGEATQIVDFVLSCRVMGRKVEEAMLAAAVRHAQTQGKRDIIARCAPTPKNSPCQSFFKQCGWASENGANVYRWQAKQPYDFPSQVQVVFTKERP